MNSRLRKSSLSVFMDQELATLGFTASHLTCQYVSKLVPIDQRQNVRVIDVGAGTGRGAREVRLDFCNIKDTF